MEQQLVLLLLISLVHFHETNAADFRILNLGLPAALSEEDTISDNNDNVKVQAGELLMLTMEATLEGQVKITETRKFSTTSGLPVKDPMGGLPDPYIQAWYTDVDFYKFLGRTNIVFNDQNPVWKDVIMFRNFDPAKNQVLKFDLKDFDKLSMDDYIGTAMVNINACMTPAAKGEVISKAPMIYECTEPFPKMAEC